MASQNAQQPVPQAQALHPQQQGILAIPAQVLGQHFERLETELRAQGSSRYKVI